jgi:hypothetical protein
MSEAKPSRQRARRAVFHADSGKRVLRRPGAAPPIGKRAAKAMSRDRLSAALAASPASLVAVDHPAFLQPADLETPLWRYMDWSKFEWLAVSGRLYMSPLKGFKDQLEGTSPAAHGMWWTEQASAAADDKRSIVASNREKMAQFVRDFREGYYVSCWRMDADERASCWKEYASGPDSVVIRTTYSALRRCVPAFVYMGVVRYIDYSRDHLPDGGISNLFHYVMHKDVEYRREQEVRTVAQAPAVPELGLDDFNASLFVSERDPTFQIFAPPIALKDLIHEVIVHPGASAAFMLRVARLCEEHGLPMPQASRVAL